jgi:23S rRNA pseudouridine1911/1915/1917 synthase
MPEAAGTFQFLADRGDAGRRLDHTLVRRLTAVSRLSRTRAQQWIELGAVSIDGRPTRRPSARVTEGASVLVTYPPTVVLKTTPGAEPGALTIVHEDDALLVVDKPAGIVVHPSYKRTSGTLLNGLLWHLRDRGGVTPGILTRLDKDTSGLVAVALRPSVHARWQRDAAAGRVRKEYLALVSGWPEPDSGRLCSPLGRDPDDRRRIIATPDGAASETRYEVEARHDSPAGRVALVRCELVTGRTHQIRVHLSAAGWPVLGDRTYGQADDRIARQALHAWRVTFPHPSTGAPLSLAAPIPADMRRVVA